MAHVHRTSRRPDVAFKDPVGAHRTAGIPVVGALWRDQEIDGDDIAGMIFKDCTLERVRLVRTSLWQTLFVNTRFEDCVFEDCRLFRTQWIECSGSGFRIVEGEFAEAMFAKCTFREIAVERAGDRITFADCRLGRLAFNGDGCQQRGLTVSECTFDAVAAENVSWQSATAVALDFAPWTLTNAVFERGMFVQAQAPGLDFSSVRFEQCNLVKGNYRETRFRHAPGTILAETDCAGADFVGAELTGALFAKAHAPGARFRGATLTNAMFPEANLVEADFSGAKARQSVWIGADLTDANFERVDAYRSSFRNGILARTRMDGARLVQADLHGVEQSLDGADLTGSRKTTGWRAEREAEARRPP